MNYDIRTYFQVIITTFNEITENEYLDPRTAQVAVVDHVKQVISGALNCCFLSPLVELKADKSVALCAEFDLDALIP